MSEVENVTVQSGRTILQAKRTIRKKPTVKKIGQQTVEDYHFNGSEKVALDTDGLMHHGVMFHLSDVVRIIGEDKQTYYGQINRFLADGYSEKYAQVQWLVPRESIATDGCKFIPTKYSQGPFQAEPISMRNVEFVKRVATLDASIKHSNKCGELAIVFNTNLPKKTSVSIPHTVIL